MTNFNKVSIIVATYNASKYLKKQLDSILTQATRAEEIIICDDHSTDETVLIITPYLVNKRIKLFVNNERLGVVENFKKAARLAQKGNWMVFTDQDDIWMPSKLSRLTEEMYTLDDGVKPALIFSDLTVIDKDDNVVSVSFWEQRNIKPEKVKFSSLLFGNIVTGCTMIINEAMAREFFCMDNKLFLHDEWLALIAYSFGSVKFLRDKLVLYRQHENNLTYSIYFEANKPKYKFSIDFCDLLGKGKFLSRQFELARLFLKIYQERLTNEQIVILENFIELEHRSYLLKRFKRFISYC
jgi:glycosyltransferase involved in cell wall biosynthesis